MMNFKNLVWLVTFLFFAAILAGCGAIEGGVKGAFADLNSLQKFAQSGVEKDIPFDQKWKEEQQLHEKIRDEKLIKLKELFLTPGVDPGVAVANAKDVAVTTGSHLAWEKLVDVYFLGQQKLALEWLERVPELGFALAILDSGKFSINDQKKVVSLTCDQHVLDSFLDLNSPTKVKAREVAALKKSCVVFK